MWPFLWVVFPAKDRWKYAWFHFLPYLGSGTRGIAFMYILRAAMCNLFFSFCTDSKTPYDQWPTICWRNLVPYDVGMRLRRLCRFKHWLLCVRVIFIGVASGKYYVESVADKWNMCMCVCVCVCVALLECSSRGNTTVLGGKPVPVPPCLPQILLDWLGIKLGPLW